MPRSIRPYLEYQADRLETVLAAHRAPGRVTGGTVGPRLIRFFLNPAPHIRFSSIKSLVDDMALALHVPTLRIDRGEEGIVLEFPNPNPRPVELLSLLSEVMPLPIATALLGLTDDGVPLLARLSAPEVAHILISGTTGSGKSVLLQTIAASLILTHSPQTLRMMCLDPKGRTFNALASVPHLTRPIVTSPAEILEALRSLVRMMEVRDQRGEVPMGTPVGVAPTARNIEVPRVVVMIDELADLVMQGGKPAVELLTRLVQRGREAGIHLIAATQRPSSVVLSGLMRANFPLRLVGRVVSAEDARVASGRAGTNAHLLNGRGDFLAVNGGDRPLRFQVAHISEKDLKSELATLWEPKLAPIALRHSVRHSEMAPQLSVSELIPMTGGI
ncbi:MAG: DNA translocase FtsK [Anaerolineae bacterium]|nr:DNA translocase FtsK [Anaerolineae bacterium]